MFLNNKKKIFYGLKSRITLTFVIVFLIIISITTTILFMILNNQNNYELENIYKLKTQEIHNYLDKLEDYSTKYGEKKIKLKFDPIISNQRIEYSKPFNPGVDDLKYILHIKSSKNNLDAIALNTSGYELNVENLETKFKSIPDNIITYKHISLSDVNKKNNFSVIKIKRIIKGAIFEIYILKDVENYFNMINILKNLFIISTLFGLGLILFMSRILSKRILKPINNIIKTSKEISNGDLRRRIESYDTKDELRDLTNIINEMLDKINISFEKQSRFISDASHELRTPISIMKGYAELISRRYISNLNDVEKKEMKNELLIESIDSIIKESDNMSNLINSLLFLSKNDESISISNQVEIFSKNILKELENDYNILKKDSIVIEELEDFIFYADKNLLLQSLRIIIENAIKYSNKKVYLSSKMDKKEKLAYISVRDEGVGISEKDIDKIFDRFYRIDESRNKDTGGYGLGLSIFKRILEIQKQDFRIESKVNVGTKISIIIKLGK